MQNETGILIYQTEEGNTKIDVRLENETVWMTQKAIAELYQRAITTINEHIKNVVKLLDDQIYLKYYTVVRKEGSRKIKRRILHYNLDVIFNVAIRGQYFEEFNRLLDFTKVNGLKKDFLTFVPIKERKFGEMLKSSLEGILDIYSQFGVEKYIADFYIPDLKLVIEYDEKHHRKQIESDKIRQKFIEDKLGVQFIRVNEGDELEGLNRILKFLLNKI